MNTIKYLPVRMFGIVLEFIGKVICKEHIINLGHYLAGSGKPRVLSSKFKEYILDLYTNDRALKHDDEWEIISILALDNMELYNSLGKFLVKVVDDRFYLKDYYTFYPWCGVAGHFHDNCDCDEEVLEWGPNDIYLEKLASPFDTCKHRTELDIGVNLDGSFYCDLVIWNKQILAIGQQHSWLIGISWDRASLRLEFCDRIFANLGVPFYTTAVWKV